MVSLPRRFMAAAGGGLSGQTVHETVSDAAHNFAYTVGQGAANNQDLGAVVAAAAQQMTRGFDLAAQSMNSVGSVAEKATGAASVAGLGQSSFSWGGYIQAVGILFVLVAVLFLVVWLARRFGKFNFLPRPGSLPRDALLMEAQLPLGPRKGLMVVRFLNRRLLLGVTDQQITLLTEERTQDDSGSADFEQIMEEARQGSGSR